MFRLIVVTCVIAACSAQIDPKDAKILKEQRFNAGDGRAGTAFATEDGHVFREETDIDGNRVGEYSYIGENGQTYTVKYSAGKDGFRVLDGSHVPSNGQSAAAFDAQELEQPAAPVQVAQPIQQQQQQQVVQQQPQIRDYDDVEEVQDPNFNPFVNPHDPTHRDFAFNKNGGDFAPKGSVPAGSFNGNLVPNCADCSGVNPFVNPFDASHTQAGLLAGQQAFTSAQNAPRAVAPPAPRPQQQQQFVPVQQQQQQQVPVVRETTTTHPRFFPPGELKLNRFETGFNFDFQS